MTFTLLDADKSGHIKYDEMKGLLAEIVLVLQDKFDREFNRRQFVRAQNE